MPNVLIGFCSLARNHHKLEIGVLRHLGGAVNRDFTDLTERFESMAYFSLKIISMVKNYTRDAKHSSSLTLQCIPHTMTIPIQFTTHQTAI
jgi:hypothetical protein